MTVELKERQEKLVEQLIASGKFDSAEAVLDLALKTLTQALAQPQVVNQGDTKVDFKSFLESMPVDLDFVERDKSLARAVEL